MYLGDAAAVTVPYSCPTRVLTTSTDCDNAQASITALQATFASLGSPAKYQASVDATVAAFNQANGWGVSGPGLCYSVMTVGCSADQLTNQMLVDNGQQPITGPSAGNVGIPLPSVPQLAAGIGTGAVILGVAALYFFSQH